VKLQRPEGHPSDTAITRPVSCIRLKLDEKKGSAALYDISTGEGRNASKLVFEEETQKNDFGLWMYDKETRRAPPEGVCQQIVGAGSQGQLREDYIILRSLTYGSVYGGLSRQLLTNSHKTWVAKVTFRGELAASA